MCNFNSVTIYGDTNGSEVLLHLRHDRRYRNLSQEKNGEFFSVVRKGWYLSLWNLTFQFARVLI